MDPKVLGGISSKIMLFSCGIIEYRAGRRNHKFSRICSANYKNGAKSKQMDPKVLARISSKDVLFPCGVIEYRAGRRNHKFSRLC